MAALIAAFLFAWPCLHDVRRGFSTGFVTPFYVS